MEDQSLNIVQEGTVSVIIPCYNYGHFLREAIASVMRQSYPNWECIIIDDGSSDNTREVAGELCLQDSRIKYIHQANQGTAAARNAGLKHSKGQFIQFLDADDLIEKHKFVCQIQFLIANPHIDVVYSGARMFSGSMHERVFLPEAIQELNTSGRGLNIVKDFLNGKLPLMSSPIFRRSILEDVGLFIEQIKASEDYEFWLRCALTDKSFYFLSVNNTNTLIRKGHQSLSCNTYKMFIGTVLAHRALVDKTNGEYRDLLNKRQQELVRLYGEQLYKATVYVGFKKHGWELLRAAAIVKHPFLGKLVMAAALDKTKQLLSVAKKRLEVEKA